MSRSLVRSKGRQALAPFVMLSRHMLQSEQWASLTSYEVKLLIDLAVQYNGSNNGDLCATWTILCRCGWKSPATLHRAIHGLLDKQFIEWTRRGGKHCCSLYALTFRGIDWCGGKLDVAPNPVPSNRWKNKIPAPLVKQSTPNMNQSTTDLSQKAV